MKLVSLILIVLSHLSLNLNATDKIIVKLVTIPIYHLWEDGPVRFARLPRVGWDLTAAHCAAAYSQPLGKGLGKDVAAEEKDINLISAYNIKVRVSYEDPPNPILTINIDTTESSKPEGYRFTVLDVSKMAAKAVGMDYLDKKGVVITMNEKSIDLKSEKKPK
ncbi:MAG: hypothetical protein ACJAQT_005303 [Akkermansiaceae bacterium]|jgi:hypothetical protein